MEFFFIFLTIYKKNSLTQNLKGQKNEKILIDAEKNEEVRVAIVDKENLIDYESEKIKNDRIKGNIYLAKIVRVDLLFKLLL